MNAGVTEKAVLYSRSRFSCEPSEIGAAKPDGARVLREAPAAFRRLCVETGSSPLWLWQCLPAAFRRLCVETGKPFRPEITTVPAAFRRLCVETPRLETTEQAACIQPPSGGCVLKQSRFFPAAFFCSQPPSGGCVLKPVPPPPSGLAPIQPPSGGCVLKRRPRPARQ